MKVVIFHIGNPTPIFETEFELMKQHEKAGDAVLVLQCKGRLETCLWNPEHKFLKCAECRSKFKNALVSLKLGTMVAVKELCPPRQLQVSFPERFESIAELSRYEFDGVCIGVGVASTLVSNLRDHQFDTLKNHGLIIKELKAAIQTYEALKDEVTQFQPDLVYIFNGRISTQLPAILLCNKLGIKFSTYEISLGQENSYSLFEGSVCHDKAIFHGELERLWATLEPDGVELLHKWFVTQRFGRYVFQKHIKIGNLPVGIDTGKRNIAIFNTSFDEYQHIHNVNDEIGEDDNVKLARILEDFKSNPEFIFYLRVHPNLKGVPKTNSQLRAIEQLRREYKNLVVIQPEECIDSYQLMLSCEKTITFGSTLGVESTYWGRPSIMLGNADYEGLGCAYIPSTHEEAISLIRARLPALPPESALKYGLMNRAFAKPYEFFAMDSSGTPCYQGMKMKPTLSFRIIMWPFSRIFHAVQHPERALRYLARGVIRALRSISTNVWNTIVPKHIRLAKRVGPYKSYSQAHQDVFVLEMLEKKREGYYVEVGAYDEIDHSNTYTLEKNFGWRGISLELDEEASADFNSVRRNKCYCCDATTFDYEQHFEQNLLPRQIDYLSLDIEPAFQTLEVLKRLPLAKYRFSVITYEHDMYVSGTECMLKSRELLESFGYIRVVSNVRWAGRDFEDWYVDPNIIPEHRWKPYSQAGVEHSVIFSKLK